MKYSVLMIIVSSFILQFYFNILFMNKLGECYLPSKVRRHYFSIIFNEKKCALYSIKYVCKNIHKNMNA